MNPERIGGRRLTHGERRARSRYLGSVLGLGSILLGTLLASPLLLLVGLIWLGGNASVPESVPGTVQVLAVPRHSVVSGLFVSTDGTRQETVIDMPVSHPVAVGETLRAYYVGDQHASETEPASPTWFWVAIGVLAALTAVVVVVLWRERGWLGGRPWMRWVFGRPPV
jgi:hypothetical protein